MARSSWSGRPTQFTLQVLSEAEKIVKDSTAFALQQVITRSPIDTGAYRGNHQVSIGKPDNTFDLEAKDLTSAYVKAGGVISKIKIGNLVYVQNCLPYSLKLENGWSKQAPQGVYSLAFQALANRYK